MNVVKHKAEAAEAVKTFSLGWKARLLLTAALLATLGALVYPVALRELALSVLHREGSSHGLFVPFISGWFVWLKRERIRRARLHFSWLPGSIAAATGILLFLLSRGSAEFSLQLLSFLTIACGLVLLILGAQVFKEMSFPLLFLATIIPLPETIYDAVGHWMRQATTTGSVWLMQALQVPVYRDGYTIQLPNARVFVDTGCSGIRYLLSYFVFSLPYAFIYKKSLRTRALVVLASLPIGPIAGVLRLSSIYVAVYFIGPFMAEHRPHIALSWSVFVGVLVLAVASDQYVSRMGEKRKSVGMVE
jgi:exosortase